MAVVAPMRCKDCMCSLMLLSEIDAGRCQKCENQYHADEDPEMDEDCDEGEE